MTATEHERDPFWQTAVLADLDRFAALPDWLLAATRPAAVAPALAQAIPECARGDMAVAACKIGGLRLSADGRGWTGAYRLTLDTPATGEQTAIELPGRLFPPGHGDLYPVTPIVAFGAAGWHCTIPELRIELAVPLPDRLPVLRQLASSAEARTLLEHSLHASDPQYRDVRIAACQPEILRHHPGLRATLRYYLRYSDDPPGDAGWPTTLIAKTYDDEKGRHAYDGMCALWRSPLAKDERVRIAEPIAYLPDLKLLIQGPIPEEQTLTDLLATALRTQDPATLAELDTALRKTAMALAALHQAEIATDRAYGWIDELAEVRAFTDRLATAVPALARAATPLLATLDVYAAITTPDPPVFAHGTFRPNQVLLHGGRVGLIDFDSWCSAEPAVDLALFLTSIRDIGLSAIRKAAGSPDPTTTDE